MSLCVFFKKMYCNSFILLKYWPEMITLSMDRHFFHWTFMMRPRWCPGQYTSMLRPCFKVSYHTHIHTLTHKNSADTAETQVRGNVLCTSATISNPIHYLAYPTRVCVWVSVCARAFVNSIFAALAGGKRSCVTSASVTQLNSVIILLA